ncbi:M1 family metallopeptidase [Sporosarcina aquimarina]|uniref:M1 family metallopeptidase n=1 Tax=Sporosarcina aquimarina TaxID=114975 RepID=A0ABU4G0N7_9BACL|nr:M1 family metallopeptidase [Sporosarcina aquimarina]MDW0110534.1 M1 family metallopeptidase [Sporosarcina aquimarina]
MNKLIILVLSSLFVLTGCSQKSVTQPTSSTSYSTSELSTDSITYGPVSPDYKIEADYDEDRHQLNTHLQVAFENNVEDQLEDLYFNLWPNADEFEEGSIDIQTVHVNGEEVSFTIEDTVLSLSGFLLKHDEMTTIEMDFNVQIPELQHRFGWSERQVSLGNWFPILAVYDAHEWNTHPYYADGESFYSITGDYDVTFTVPDGLEVAATGERKSVSHTKDGLTYKFSAKQVRDFAAVFNTGFKSLQDRIQGTDMIVLFLPGEENQAQLMLEAAQKTMPLYNEKYGEYPWNTLTIVSTDYGQTFDGGMEYPQLVTINTPTLSDEEELGLTVAHEIAHQWFYSLVGNDQYREPWLDESLTTFASYAAYYETTDFDWIEEEELEDTITSPVSAFQEDTSDRYGNTMYDGGAQMLSELHDLLGENVFFKGMRTYVDEMQFGIATTADFIRIMQQVSEENLKPFFTEHGVYLQETIQ